MNQLHAVQVQLRQIGRCAFAGTLVALMATQAIAQSAPALQPSTQLAATPATPQVPDAAPALPATQSAPAALPDAPSTIETATLTTPPKLNLMLAAPGQSGQSLQPAAKTSEHKVKPGWLVLGVVGAAAMTMGVLIYSINTTQTTKKAELGTMFFAPGAAAAGFGFYYGFHSKN
jgi:hypothetical protein